MARVAQQDDGNGFTASDYMRRYNVCHSTAIRHLNWMIENGKVTVSNRIRDGKWVRVYELA